MSFKGLATKQHLENVLAYLEELEPLESKSKLNEDVFRDDIRKLLSEITRKSYLLAAGDPCRCCGGSGVRS